MTYERIPAVVCFFTRIFLVFELLATMAVIHAASNSILCSYWQSDKSDCKHTCEVLGPKFSFTEGLMLHT